MFSPVSLKLHPDFLNNSKDQLYLLAISGGRDSVALFHTLLEQGFRSLVLCHLNHQLRGEESDKDAQFVQELAEKNSLGYEIGSENVAKRAEEFSESIELAARHARHAFFNRCANKYSCNRILLAHHADDQAETILFNLLRGSSGLKGMHYRNQYHVDGVLLELLRPLFKVTRRDIDHYIKTQNIPYREDSTNAEPFATRNRLRNEAIPLLENIMGRDIRANLIRAQNFNASQEECINHLLDEDEVYDPQSRLYLPGLTKLPIALQKLALHRYLSKHHIPEISNAVIERCMTLFDPESPAKVNLPSGRFLRRKEKRLFIDD